MHTYITSNLILKISILRIESSRDSLNVRFLIYSLIYYSKILTLIIIMSIRYWTNIGTLILIILLILNSIYIILL
jgi:hypothetical protein